MLHKVIGITVLLFCIIVSVGAVSFDIVFFQENNDVVIEPEPIVSGVQLNVANPIMSFKQEGEIKQLYHVDFSKNVVSEWLRDFADPNQIPFLHSNNPVNLKVDILQNDANCDILVAKRIGKTDLITKLENSKTIEITASASNPVHILAKALRQGVCRATIQVNEEEAVDFLVRFGAFPDALEYAYSISFPCKKDEAHRCISDPLTGDSLDLDACMGDGVDVAVCVNGHQAVRDWKAAKAVKEAEFLNDELTKLSEQTPQELAKQIQDLKQSNADVVGSVWLVLGWLPLSLIFLALIGVVALFVVRHLDLSNKPVSVEDFADEKQKELEDSQKGLFDSIYNFKEEDGKNE